MADIRPSIVLQDSKGTRYLFFYRDSSIYYREVTSAGDTKDTILISQANGDYAAAIDSDDTVYLTCNSRYKGVLLFIYNNNGWKFETVVNLHNSSNIYIMDILVMSGSIHIFFAKKLPVANLFNVYHIHKNLNEQSPYIEYSWRKNSLSEIYSQSIENSYSILPLKGGLIHYASVWYDGALFYIDYCCYDDSSKSWLHKSFNISFKNQLFIKLVYQNKRLSLLCFSYENEESNIHHFLSKSTGAGEIDFKELNSSYIDTGGIPPLFYSDDKTLQLAWVKDNAFHQYVFDDSSGKWKKVIDLPVTTDSYIHMVKVMKSSNPYSISKGYFLIDRDYNIYRPIEHASRSAIEEKAKEKLLTAVSTETNDYLKQILDQIKDLAENVKFLNSRIDNLEGRSFVQKYPEELQKELTSRPRTVPGDDSASSALKKSNFKDQFLKSSSTLNYDSLLSRHDSVTTFIGKPSAGGASSAAAPYENNANDELPNNEKHAYVLPPDAAGTSDSNVQEKGNNLIKKIGEFFK